MRVYYAGFAGGDAKIPVVITLKIRRGELTPVASELVNAETALYTAKQATVWSIQDDRGTEYDACQTIESNGTARSYRLCDDVSYPHFYVSYRVAEDKVVYLNRGFSGTVMYYTDAGQRVQEIQYRDGKERRVSNYGADGGLTYQASYDAEGEAHGDEIYCDDTCAWVTRMERGVPTKVASYYSRPQFEKEVHQRCYEATETILGCVCAVLLGGILGRLASTWV